MVNKENLRKWVAALRSGDFRQATGKLQSEDGKMCCLGVASELYRRETGKGEWSQTVNEDYFWFIDQPGNGSEDFLVTEVQDWLGIHSKNPELDCVIGSDPDYVSASELNDDHDFTFEMIAAAIERTYEL